MCRRLGLKCEEFLATVQLNSKTSKKAPSGSTRPLDRSIELIMSVQEAATSATTGQCVTIIVWDCISEVASRLIFPQLWHLLLTGNSDQDTFIIDMSPTETVPGTAMEEMCFEHVHSSRAKRGVWQKKVHFIAGGDMEDGGFDTMLTTLIRLESSFATANRLFFFASDPGISVKDLMEVLRESHRGWNRAVCGAWALGMDHTPFAAVYFPDHYLSVTVIRSLLTLRFTNRLMEAVWDNRNIDCVLIRLHSRKSVLHWETIMSLFQTHLLSLVCLVAMDTPASFRNQDIREAMSAVMPRLNTIDEARTFFARCPAISNAEEPTLASLVITMEHKNWKKVPFILTAGYGLKKDLDEIRIQFKAPDKSSSFKEELVLELHPNEAIYQWRVTLQQPESGSKSGHASAHKMMLSQSGTRNATWNLESVFLKQHLHRLAYEADTPWPVPCFTKEHLQIAQQLLAPLFAGKTGAKMPHYKQGSKEPQELRHFYKQFKFDPASL